MKKKKIVFHSDFSLMKTGFGRAAKALLSYLYKTNKYEIVHYCCHVTENFPDLKKTPWKSIGCMPEHEQTVNQALAGLNEHEKQHRMRAMWYGAYNIDRVIQNEKPDFYFGVQDIWGVDYSIDKPWFNVTNSVIWTTLDSLPILPGAVQKADKIKNYWIWSSFATKALHQLGHKHVQTVHGPLEDKNFYPIDSEKRLAIRRCFGIEDDRFVVGFVFRNQLRKSLPNLIEGYKLFKDKNPSVKSCLLLHTSFSEGWRIIDIAQQNQVPLNEIWTTYTCRNCRNYVISPFLGEEKDCPKCHVCKSLFTTNMMYGVSEEQLNEVYNAMDCYVHPFTSGGQEIPIQEAKLAGLVTAVTNYSCGEEMNEPDAHSIALDWQPYREFETEFIKATTLKESICDAITNIYSMTPEDRKSKGLKAREWAINNFSIEYVGKLFEQFLDSAPEVKWSELETKQNILKNPNGVVNDSLPNTLWIKSLYKNILNMDVSDNDSGYLYWMAELAKGADKQQIKNFFRNTAIQENAKNIQQTPTKPLELEDLLDKDDADKRILYVMPEGFGDLFLSTSLFKSLKNQYPWCNLYVATKPEYADILNGNPYVHKVLPYTPMMDSLLTMEGHGNFDGYFKIAFLPYVTTQRFLTYVHNGLTKIAYKDLKD